MPDDGPGPSPEAATDAAHRLASADDRCQVEELNMVRWRQRPGREWERLARRMGRTAAALHAWVRRNRLPRWRRHPWTESQLRRIRAQWNVGVAAGWSDRKIARAAALVELAAGHDREHGPAAADLDEPVLRLVF